MYSKNDSELSLVDQVTVIKDNKTLIYIYIKNEKKTTKIKICKLEIEPNTVLLKTYPPMHHKIKHYENRSYHTYWPIMLLIF